VTLAASLLVLDPAADSILARLRGRFPALAMAGCASYAALPAALARHRPQAVLTSRIGDGAFPRDVLFAAPSVRWVATMGAGVNHLVPWDAERVTVTNASGVYSEVMSQYVLGVILMANLQLATYLSQQAERRWLRHEIRSTEGQTLTILGYGSIGQAIGRRARAFGMRTIGVRARPELAGAPGEVAGGEVVGGEVVGSGRLHEALAAADYAVSCLPLSPRTQGLVDAAALARMKRSAYLIDVGRGGVVEEAALVAALRRGELAGAALDVFAEEPLPAASPLWGLPNVLVTPHSAANLAGWIGAALELFEAQLERWLAGAPLRNRVDPDRGY